MNYNESNVPRTFLTTLRVTGIDKVDVETDNVANIDRDYRKKHDVTMPPFVPRPAAVGPLVPLTWEERFLVAAQFYTDNNVNMNGLRIFGGLERLNHQCDFDYHKFGLVPVIDKEIDINEGRVPSWGSFIRCRQEIPGPMVCRNFPNLERAIYEFWEQPVRLHDISELYCRENNNENTTWSEHMRKCDAVVYRAAFQAIPNQVKNQRNTINRSKHAGGPDLNSRFKFAIINIIATAVYRETVCICCTPDQEVNSLMDMKGCHDRRVQEVFLMVVCPSVNKYAKIANKHGFTMENILECNVKNRVIKDCYEYSMKNGVWSLDGLMPRLRATNRYRNRIAPPARPRMGPGMNGVPHLTVPTHFTSASPDRHICKGNYYRFHRLWRCIAREDMKENRDKLHLTDAEKQNMNRELAHVAGPDLQVGLLPAPPVVLAAGVAGPVQELPPVPLRPMNGSWFS